MVERRWTSFQMAFGATPPKLPECTSRFAVLARNSKLATPRAPKVMTGSPDS